MRRKVGKYTYIPKDEIAEVRTFNDVSFESDDLLDGAYVRGRKKFKHGGMTHNRPMSLEEQAAESVGYDTWYAMEAVDQKELVDELLVSGMINPMFASGGIYSSDDRWVVKFQNQDTGEFEEVVVSANNKKSAIDIAEDESGLSSDWEYYSAKKAMARGGYMADGGMMADGGYVKAKTLSDLSEFKVGKKYVFRDTRTDKIREFKYFGISDKDDMYAVENYAPFAERLKTAKNKMVFKQIGGDENSDMSIGAVLTTSPEIVEREIKKKNWKLLEDGGMMADGGQVKSKYKVGDMVYSYQNKDYPATISYTTEISYPNEKVKYKLKLKDGYSNWINEDSLSKSKMADGGELTEKQSAIEEALKIATIAYQNDITASGNSLEKFANKIFDASGISFAKAYLALAYQSMRNQGYADGGEISYVVKYSMKDTPEVVKEKIFADKDAAELFHETISDDEDLVVMDLQVLKPKPVVAPQPAKKSSLFASAKPIPATATARKKVREQVQVNGIADEIARYDQLKANINNAKAEQEVIGGRLKELGREKFLELYEQRGVRPANFDLADGDQNILLEVTDKYLKVEPEKAELLRQFDGLLEEKTTYEFDSELLEKQVSDGMTIGDVVSMLIQDSKLIPDSDKANLIKAKMMMRVPKGTIDRLMQYDNPREVFSLISPILALK
jgi:hypothetical protein